MTIDHVALAAELNGDPVALGYAPLITAKNWAGLAALVNALRAGATVNPGVVPAYKVVNCIVKSAYDALTAADKSYINFVLARSEVDVTPGEVRTAFLSLFPAGATRTNLTALVNRPATRAEELFGANTQVTHEDCIRAVRGAL